MIKLSDATERNFYGVSEKYASELINNGYSLEYDEETEKYTVYDEGGNDVEIMTCKEISER